MRLTLELYNSLLKLFFMSTIFNDFLRVIFFQFHVSIQIIPDTVTTVAWQMTLSDTLVFKANQVAEFYDWLDDRLTLQFLWLSSILILNVFLLFAQAYLHTLMNYK